MVQTAGTDLSNPCNLECYGWMDRRMDTETNNCNSKTKVGIENLCNLLCEALVLHSKDLLVVVTKQSYRTKIRH